MDMSSAAKAFDATGAENYARPVSLLRVVPPVAKQEARPEARPEAPSVAEAPALAPASQAAGGFAAGKRTNWAAIGVIAGLHAALLVGLVSMDVVKLKLPVAEPMLVSLVPATPPPPPPAPVFQPRLEAVTPVIVPPALDILPPRPSPVQAVVAETPPAQAVSTPTPAPAPAPAPQGVVSTVNDLSTTMISAVPPRYPVESRRRKEEGTVTLMVTVSPRGDVAEIEVARSSGFSRLDKAALAAVKHWRWSPSLRNGVAVPVRGIVEIPFILKKS